MLITVKVPEKLLNFVLQKLFLGSFTESQLQSKTAFGRCEKLYALGCNEDFIPYSRINLEISFS